MQGRLFDNVDEEPGIREMPLAARMRPRSLDEFLGQEHVIGPGRVLRRSIEADRLGSIVFWGPPGSGKTTLALIIARMTRSHFSRVSAVAAGVADLRRVVDEARKRRKATGQRTILFIDEIHRFNKAQQDAILPFVENGTVILIGATTENPSFEVNAALLSRSRVFALRALSEEEIRQAVLRALQDPERGLGELRVELEQSALDSLAVLSDGDARVALNALELAVQSGPPGEDGVRHVTLSEVEDALQQRALLYDKAGDQHYDAISALHKSLRSSDPDAGLYWLGRMLEAGEDPLYIARRLVRFASEDVGLADPQALVVAMAAQQAVHFIGLPEGNLALAQVTVYLATAPKSNALYVAYGKVREDVQRTRNEPVPLHLRNVVTGLMKELGYGKGYKYAHDEADKYQVDQEHLPPSLRGRRYYEPTEDGYERVISERLEAWRKQRER
ncbi:MAG: replication-associated recombination protein A [Chloroflexota bacterium]|nr:MAG: replication-associated recombination protein A [Chloroflexota bacterium]